MFQLFAPLLALLVSLIQLPAGVAARNFRGLGNFLFQGLWQILGLPSPAAGATQFFDALWARLSEPDLGDPASVRKVIQNALTELAPVSAKGAVKLKDDVLAAIGKFVGDDKAWRLLAQRLACFQNGQVLAAGNTAALDARAAELAIDPAAIQLPLANLLNFILQFLQAVGAPKLAPLPAPEAKAQASKAKDPLHAYAALSEDEARGRLAGCTEGLDPVEASSQVISRLTSAFGPIAQKIVALIEAGITNLPAILQALEAAGFTLPPWVNLVIELLLVIVPQPKPQPAPAANA